MQNVSQETNGNHSEYCAAPTGPPRYVEVLVINSKSINITWSSVLDEDTNGIVRSFVINVTDNEQTRQVTVSARHLYHNIRSLRPYTNYSISLAAATVDTGPFSSEVMVEMPEDGMVTPVLVISVNV